MLRTFLFVDEDAKRLLTPCAHQLLDSLADRLDVIVEERFDELR